MGPYTVAQAIDAMSVASSQNFNTEEYNMTIRTKLLTAIYCAFGAAAFIAASSAANAGTLDVRTKTVRYDDLDLAKPAGAQALYSRIRVAAREVCESLPGVVWSEAAAEHACIEKAIDGAVEKVNSPGLTTLRFGSDIRLASK